MNQHTITLVLFGQFSKRLLDTVSDAVSHEFLCVVNRREARVDLSTFFDSGRRQYNGDMILNEISSMKITGPVKVIGLVSVDLFIPILTYIFGQAQLGGKTAVASLYRLSNESYGMPENKEILYQRFAKEIIHELGHTFGLIHCHNLNCVMQSSTYVEDIDQKEARFCDECRKLISILPAF